jgi:hypothetical protein
VLTEKETRPQVDQSGRSMWRRSRGLEGGLVSFSRTYERSMPPMLVPRTEHWLGTIPVALGHPACRFFFIRNSCKIYI